MVVVVGVVVGEDEVVVVGVEVALPGLNGGVGDVEVRVLVLVVRRRVDPAVVAEAAGEVAHGVAIIEDR
jgi:hypothetical protein